jgi:hypothetical protein
MHPGKQAGEPAVETDPDLVKLAWIAAAFASRESFAGAEANSEGTSAKAAAETKAEAAERLHSLLLAYLPNVLGVELAQAVNDATKNADFEAASLPDLLTLFLSSESSVPLAPDDSACDAAMNAVTESFGGIYDPLAFVAAFVAASQAAEKGEDLMTEAAAAAQASYDSRAVELDATALKLKLLGSTVVFVNSATLASVDIAGKAILIANGSAIEKATLGGNTKLAVYDSVLKRAFVSDKAIATAIDSEVDVAFLLGKGAAYGVENLQLRSHSANEPKPASGPAAVTIDDDESDCGC